MQNTLKAESNQSNNFQNTVTEIKTIELKTIRKIKNNKVINQKCIILYYHLVMNNCNFSPYKQASIIIAKETLNYNSN